MLNKEQVDRLEIHVLGMIQSVVLPEVTKKGCILTRDGEGNVRADQVTTHHLVELCLELDGRLCSEIVERACKWFAGLNESFHNPFFVTTLAVAGKIPRGTRDKITSHLLSIQNPSGFIDLYAGFLDGGSVFSTLWAVRILQLLGNNSQSKKARLRAMKAVREHWADLHRSSFKGFYLELAAHESRSVTSFGIDVALAEIIRSQRADGLWDSSPLYTAYLLGNLSVDRFSRDSGVSRSRAKGFATLFDLKSEPKGLPRRVADLATERSESLYLQTVIRSALSAVRYLQQVEKRNIAVQLASSVVGAFPAVYQTARVLEAELKKMNTQYGEIQKRFEHLEAFAKPVLQESPFEKNVFIMMPFRQSRDERYEGIERILRNQLKRAGFRGWLASDLTLAPQLWDNVAAFLLACKFGIAVFTRLERDNRIEEEFNPNVSLELGFCLSRGRQILILKDKVLGKLQTDLVGHLYDEFDLNQVNRQLPKVIRRWIKNLANTGHKS